MRQPIPGKTNKVMQEKTGPMKRRRVAAVRPALKQRVIVENNNKNPKMKTQSTHRDCSLPSSYSQLRLVVIPLFLAAALVSSRNSAMPVTRTLSELLQLRERSRSSYWLLHLLLTPTSGFHSFLHKQSP